MFVSTLDLEKKKTLSPSPYLERRDARGPLAGDAPLLAPVPRPRPCVALRAPAVLGVAPRAQPALGVRVPQHRGGLEDEVGALLQHHALGLEHPQGPVEPLLLGALLGGQGSGLGLSRGGSSGELLEVVGRGGGSEEASGGGGGGPHRFQLRVRLRPRPLGVLLPLALGLRGRGGCSCGCGAALGLRHRLGGLRAQAQQVLVLALGLVRSGLLRLRGRSGRFWDVLGGSQLPGRGDAPAGELGEEERGVAGGLVVFIFVESAVAVAVVGLRFENRSRPALVGQHRAPQSLLPRSQLERPGAQQHGESRLGREQDARRSVRSGRSASDGRGGTGRLCGGGAEPGAVAVGGEAADGGDVFGGEGRALGGGAEQGTRRARGRGAEGAGLK